MTQEEHADLMVYLGELLRQTMKARPSHDWFMQSSYMKLVNDTFSDLIVIDAEEAGL